jgi:hypothetical protein
MGGIEAAAWGVAGGAVAWLVAFAADLRVTGMRWPWRENQVGVWPYLFVLFVAMIAGGVVASAQHSQISGPWPAFSLGIAAPAVIRGALSRVEVSEKPTGKKKSIGAIEPGGEHATTT